MSLKQEMLSCLDFLNQLRLVSFCTETEEEKKCLCREAAEARVDTLISEEVDYLLLLHCLKTFADTDTNYPWVDIQ